MQKKSARVGSKNASHRLNITNTIERNIENINALKVENDQAIDPVFHKMSLAFDEGGAKGMLLTNLRLTTNTCSVIFTSLDASLNTEESANPDSCLNENQVVDISKLLKLVDFPLHEIDSITICPGIDEYRKVLNVNESVDGLIPFDKYATNSMNISVKDENASSSEAENYTYDDNIPGDMFDDGQVGGELIEDDDVIVSNLASVSINRQSILEKNQSCSKPGKIQWSAVFGESSTQPITRGVDNVDPTSVNYESINDCSSESNGFDSNGIHSAITSDNDYAFFNFDTLNKSNAWAGVKHWKYATRSQVTNKPIKELEDEVSVDSSINKNSVVSEKSGKSNKSSKSSNKAKFVIDFNTFDISLIDQSLFTIPNSTTVTGKAKANPTQLTANAIEKMESLANDLLLPSDSKVSISDLCRLFILPTMLLPPPSAVEGLKKSLTNSSNLYSSNLNSDVIWGSKSKHSQAATSNLGLPQINSEDSTDWIADIIHNDESNNQNVYCNNDSSESYEYNDDLNEVSSPPVVASSVDGLVQATRKVEKIEIKYVYLILMSALI